jgi:hypothetical protein
MPLLLTKRVGDEQVRGARSLSMRPSQLSSRPLHTSAEGVVVGMHIVGRPRASHAVTRPRAHGVPERKPGTAQSAPTLHGARH